MVGFTLDFSKTAIRCLSSLFTGVFMISILSGCAAILGSSTQTNLISQTPGTDISVACTWQFGSQDHQLMGKDTVKLKVKNARNYVVKQECPGYKTELTPLEPTRPNPGRAVAFITTGIIDLVFFNLIGGGVFDNMSEETQMGILIPSFFIGISGWWILPMGPKKLHDKEYVLPKLMPIPKQKEDEKNILMDLAAINLEEGKIHWKYYESMHHYRKGNPMHGSSSGKKINYENSYFVEDLNELLIKYGYGDTTKRLMPNSSNTLRLRTTISEYSTTVAGSTYFVELSTHWSLHDYYDKSEKMFADIHSSSKWISNVTPSDDEIHDLIADALDNAMIQFLNSDRMKELIKNDEQLLKEVQSKWENKTLVNKDPARSVPEAANAVVTLKTKDGHGSGCIISADGWIVTNYHVVGDTGGKVVVLYEDESKDTGIVVRSNSLLDLALIKTNPRHCNALKISPAKTFELGLEVYAIGTPKDLNLGQTVSRGIISGKRKMDDKVFIQTDVSVNSGNSGGALITKEGVLLGVVNAKLKGEGVEGIAFAIPAYYILEGLKVKFSE